ncbi:MAG: branched-chain amino acid ABC transporter substrate-binding protein [Planctomycetia bacterium]|nr:branched-chain amino acid ABC transporter substrate-binding protein [Planctomycetia bacterium]
MGIGKESLRSGRAAFFAFVMVASVGCRPADPNVVKIVSSLPRTGSAKQQSDTIVGGIRMAIEEAGGTAGPFRVEYLDLDDSTAAAGQWTSEAEAANARRALQDPDVVAYIGTFNSGAAKVSMPILNLGDLLMVSPANTAVGLTKPGLGVPGEPGVYRPTGRLNYARVVPADDLQGPLSADWAKRRGVRKVYILDDNEVYGKGIADLFDERCREIGIEVLGHDSIDAKAQEFKSLMASVKAARPDLVYFGGTTQSKGGQLAKDMASAGIHAMLMVPDGCREQVFIDSAGAANLEGRCFVTFGGLPPEKLTGKGAEFVARYREKHGELPEAYAVYGYEAACVALRAIRDAGVKDRRAISDAALALKDFDGALGDWGFDENGDTTMRTLTVSVVRGGKFEFEEILDANAVGEGGSGSDRDGSSSEGEN